MEICSHPPHRLYACYAYNLITDRADWPVVVCCACHTILKGGAEEYEAHLSQYQVS